MPPNGVCNAIVRVAGDGDRLDWLKLFNAWRCERDDLEVDARGVHFGNAALIEVAQLGDQGRKGSEVIERVVDASVEQSGCRVVLFEADGAHRERLLRDNSNSDFLLIVT